MGYGQQIEMIFGRVVSTKSMIDFEHGHFVRRVDKLHLCMEGDYSQHIDLGDILSNLTDPHNPENKYEGEVELPYHKDASFYHFSFEVPSPIKGLVKENFYFNKESLQL